MPPIGQGAATEFTFDLVAVAGMSGHYGNSSLLDHALTNSICVAAGMGSPISLTSGGSGGPNAVAGTIGVDNGGSYSVTGTLSADKTSITGTVAFPSGCGFADNGMTFTAYRYQAATGTYSGSFTPDSLGSPFSATITLTEDSNFNLTGTVTATGTPCFSHLTVDSSVGPSIASGNVLVFWGTDLNGDVVGFVANSGGSGDTPGDLTMSNLYVTEATYSGACNGQSYTDAPFQKVITKGKRRRHMKELPQALPGKKQ
jgi:hypothetical protein